MDKTPEYILMCKEALPDLPLPKQFTDGQWIVYVGKESNPFHLAGLDLNKPVCMGRDGYVTDDEAFIPDKVVIFEGYDDVTYYDICNIIPLWTQDQLQGMISDEPLGYIDGIKTMWVELDFPNYSWEQLWLALVMSEKFNKTWNGKTWITINAEG